MRKLLLGYGNGTQEAEIHGETATRYEIKRLWKSGKPPSTAKKETSFIKKDDPRIIKGFGQVVCIFCEGSGMANHGVGSCPQCRDGMIEWEL